MKFLPQIILLFCCIQTNAQVLPPVIQWQKCFGGSNDEGYSGIALTPDGGFIICGSSGSNDGDIGPNPGNPQIFVIKTDAAGATQWKKNYGGNYSEYILFSNRIINTSDGGYIFVGTTNSDDGNVSGYHPGPVAGIPDVWVVKIDNSGNIQWEKCYGGPGEEYGNTIRQTTDGGYIIGAAAEMNGGDVTGNHGSFDLWVLKIDASGNLQWQKNYGGTVVDNSSVIIQTNDGGYFLAGSVDSHDGDITCTIVRYDLWVAKLDNAGNIQWQNCLGGMYGDVPYSILQTSDGGYITAGTSFSPDLPGSYGLGGDGWVVKWDPVGNVQWQRFLGGTGRDDLYNIQQTADGGYIVAGGSSSVDGDICSNKGNKDFLIVKLNSDGSTAWRKTGGGSGEDVATSVFATSDGGYILCGDTFSNNGDVSGNHSSGKADAWLVKLSFPGVPLVPTVHITASDTLVCPGKSITFIATSTDGGNAPSYQWKINGVNIASNNDTIIVSSIYNGDVVSCVLTSNSPCVTTPTAVSNSITITVDALLPTVQISASETLICLGKNITFIATSTNGGNAPSYQWKINGVNTATNNDTVIIIPINNGDVVSCVLTSNSDCVSTTTAVSNNISITVDPSLAPANFLPATLEICSYGNLELKPGSTFKTYLWNTNAVTPSIVINQPGIYWLQVTTNQDCLGIDTVIVTPKECPKAFYMPTAFTPNNDGKNDVLKPIISGVVKQYKFALYNRWGQVVFQTTDLNKGWNGKFHGLTMDSNIYIWVCTYQFQGEGIKTERGTVVIIR